MYVFEYIFVIIIKLVLPAREIAHSDHPSWYTAIKSGLSVSLPIDI